MLEAERDPRSAAPTAAPGQPARSGPWGPDEVDRFLGQARIPIRLACRGTSGHPVLVSLWFAWRDGAFHCATRRSADVARLLARDPRCAFEVSLESPPYRGVRGAATASLRSDRGAQVLRELLDRYLPDSNARLRRTLLSRAEDEVAIEVRPLTLVSWDYRERMEPPAR